jgi:hypothetical protein
MSQFPGAASCAYVSSRALSPCAATSLPPFQFCNRPHRKVGSAARGPIRRLAHSAAQALRLGRGIHNYSSCGRWMIDAIARLWRLFERRR